jgi:hypothetical protein
MCSPLLSFGLLFRVWPEATAAPDKRARQASLGFCPLQRTELRKSTHPGFPSPGSFPSRRFSRPQGFSPSEAARACSIPLPLLGFHLQDPPLTEDALAGPLSFKLDPPEAAATRRTQAAIGAARQLETPKGIQLSRGTDEPPGRAISSLGTLWQTVKPTAGTRPSWQREPRRNRALFDRARQAGRAFLAPHGASPKASSRRAGQARTRRANSRRSWLFRGSEPRSNRCCPRDGIQPKQAGGGGKPRPTSAPNRSTFCEHKARFWPKPHRTSTQPQLLAGPGSAEPLAAGKSKLSP